MRALRVAVTDNGAVTIRIERFTDPAQWRGVWDEVLTASFPPEELDAFDALVAMIESGELVMFGTVGPGGTPTSCVMIGGGAPVAIVLYLAIGPAARGGGIGSALLSHAVAYARADLGAQIVLVEVEHPGWHAASEEHGDPVARLRFYARHGLEILAVPYFQPALRPDSPRVPALLLGTLWITDSARRGPGAVEARAIREFLEGYFAGPDGLTSDDRPTRALFASVGEDEIAVVPVGELERVPVGNLTADELFAPARSAGTRDTEAADIAADNNAGQAPGNDHAP